MKVEEVAEEVAEEGMGVARFAPLRARAETHAPGERACARATREGVLPGSKSDSGGFMYGFM